MLLSSSALANKTESWDIVSSSYSPQQVRYRTIGGRLSLFSCNFMESRKWSRSCLYSQRFNKILGPKGITVTILWQILEFTSLILL